jgi:hypothetical protein
MNDKLIEKAALIIDLVESKIREVYPFIETFANSQKGNTLLYGENYYDLENEIVEELITNA